MNSKLPLISYALAAMSGVCFMSGLVILSREGDDHIWTGLRRSYPC